MKKNYSFFAKWRKKDVEYLNSLKLNKVIKEGYDGFWVEEGDVYEVIMNKFSKKGFFSSDTPEGFSVKQSGVTFSKKEIESAKFYNLIGTGSPIAVAQPDNYREIVFSSECGNYRVNKKQISQFSIEPIKLKKNQKNFTIAGEWDKMFFNKEFYQEALKPLGLKFFEVLDYKTGKPNIEHEKQMEKYAQIFYKMDFKTVFKCLIYVNKPIKIIQF